MCWNAGGSWVIVIFLFPVSVEKYKLHKRCGIVVFLIERYIFLVCFSLGFHMQTKVKYFGTFSSSVAVNYTFKIKIFLVYRYRGSWLTPYILLVQTKTYFKTVSKKGQFLAGRWFYFSQAFWINMLIFWVAMILKPQEGIFVYCDI